LIEPDRAGQPAAGPPTAGSGGKTGAACGWRCDNRIAFARRCCCHASEVARCWSPSWRGDATGTCRRSSATPASGSGRHRAFTPISQLPTGQPRGDVW